MTPLTLTQFFIFPLLVYTIGILLIWAYYSFRDHRLKVKNRRQTYLYRCENCNHAYIDQREVPLTRCPRCGSLNERLGA